MAAITHGSGLFDAEQVRAHEQALYATGASPADLMRRAGEAAFASLRQHWPQANRIAVLVGPGQNGGDGVVLASLARAAGLSVDLISWEASPTFDGSAAVFWAQWVESGGAPVMRTDASAIVETLADADVLVDAAFGIGLNRPVEGSAAALIQAVNARHAQGLRVLAVDIPSGLLADSGHAGRAVIQADVTVTMLVLKIGLFTGQGPGVAGHVELADLERPVPSQPPKARLNTRPEPLPPRPVVSHKGTFGHLLVLAGNRGMSGAARMVAEAALRVGAGKITVATHTDHAATLNVGRPELMVHGVTDERSLIRLMNGIDAVVVGPGLGRDGWALQLARTAFRHEGPVVVDADGLRLMGREIRREWPTVITPHPGEAAELLDLSVAEVEANRPTMAQALAERFGVTALLKGAGTVVATGTDLSVCGRGHPALATAGAGDVLSGVIGGLIAQGRPLPQAAVQAVCWHAVAGELEADHSGAHGLAATDLLMPIRQLANGLSDAMKHQSELAERRGLGV